MKLKELRKSKKLTQAKLAQMAGLSQSFIGYLEAGTKDPTLTTLRCLSNALGVKVAVLIGEEQEPQREEAPAKLAG